LLVGQHNDVKTKCTEIAVFKHSLAVYPDGIAALFWKTTSLDSNHLL